MQMQVIVVEGPDQGRSWVISPGETLTIGRGTDTATQLTDRSVSRLHCQLEWTGGELRLVDKGSGSGTQINGRNAQHENIVSGDHIVIGDTLLRVENPDVADAATIPPRRSNKGPGLLPEVNSPSSPGVETFPSAEEDTGPLDPSRVRLVERPVPKKSLKGLVGRKVYSYEVKQEHVRGQTGTIFKAEDEKTGQNVALKVLWPELTANEAERERFIRAMQTMQPIRHRNLVRVFNAGITELAGAGINLCWFSMEFVDGFNLRSVIDRSGVVGMLDWQHAWRVGMHIGRALRVAFEHNVVHRNITPENILLPKAARIAMLGDLMLAKALEGTAGAGITQRGQLIGDIQYMAPERTLGETGDHRSDMYSLGVTMYVMLTGRLPFDAVKVADLIEQIQTAEPLPPRMAQLSINESFEAVVMKLLEKNPSKRYDNPDRLLSDLERTGKFAGLKIE